MLFRKSVNLFIFLCINLNCFSNELFKDNEYKALKLYLVHIDAQDAKILCDDIIISSDEFSSTNVIADSHTHSLMLAGPAYEVDLLEHIFRQKELAFKDNERKLLVLDLTCIDAQDAKSLCDDIIGSTDEFSSVSIAVASHANSLILSGLAYEVERLVKYIDDSIEGAQIRDVRLAAAL